MDIVEKSQWAANDCKICVNYFKSWNSWKTEKNLVSALANIQGILIGKFMRRSIK